MLASEFPASVISHELPPQRMYLFNNLADGKGVFRVVYAREPRSTRLQDERTPATRIVEQYAEHQPRESRLQQVYIAYAQYTR